MLKIFYNPQQPELIFSVAAAILSTDNLYPFSIPRIASEMHNAGPPLIVLKEYFSEQDDDLDLEEDIMKLENEEEEYIIIGIYPQSKGDEEILIKFLDKYEDRIKLWVDNHRWPPGLVKYFYDSSALTLIDSNYSYLELLAQIGYLIPDFWLKSEKALVKADMRNPLAARYYPAMLVNRAIGKNNNQERDYENQFFLETVDEIISAEESKLISELTKMFKSMTEKTKLIKNRLTDKNPIFSRAKAIGRPIGCLLLDRIDYYLNVEAIIDYGKQKFPWLCVLGFYHQDRYHLIFHSQKIPIDELIKGYKPAEISIPEMLAIMQEEVLRFKE